MAPIRPENVKPEDERKVHEKLDAKMKDLSGRTGLVAELISNAKMLYAMLRDPGFTIPWQDKAKIIAALLYFIAPVDVIPDFIIGMGYIDDAVVVAMTLKSLTSLVQRYREYRGEKAEAFDAEGRPRYKPASAES
jgi:uncharacterized membrane protein YkvA (DUF1232 family)